MFLIRELRLQKQYLQSRRLNTDTIYHTVLTTKGYSNATNYGTILTILLVILELRLQKQIFKVDIKYWYNLPYSTYSKGYSNATNYGTFQYYLLLYVSYTTTDHVALLAIPL